MIMKNNKHLIVVLGMHRSGTSAITRSLQTLGVELGESLIPGIRDNNEKGFFEDSEVNQLNNELLHRLNRQWHSFAAIRHGFFEQDVIADFKLRAIQLLRDRLQTSNLFGLKDPRIARLLPFWKPVFAHLGIEVSYLIAVRHPASVAESLKKRDGFDTEKSYFLWLEHVVPGVLHTEGTRRIVVDYDEVMQNPLGQLKRTARAFGLPFDEESRATREYVEDFLDRSLQHTRYQSADLVIDPRAGTAISNAWDVLSRAACDETSLDAPNDAQLFRQIEQQIDSFAPLFEYLDRREESILHYQEQIRIAERTIGERDAQINTLHHAVGERDAKINTLHHAINERDGQINTQQHAIGERDRKIDALQHVISERDGQIDTQQHAIDERDATINALQHVIGERDRKIDALQHVINERDGQIDTQQHAIGERDTKIDTLQHAINERDGQINSQQHVIGERDGQVYTLKTTLAAITSSFSWKLTAPIRWTARPLVAGFRTLRVVPHAVKLGGGYIKTSQLFLRVLFSEGIQGIAWRLNNAQALSKTPKSAGTNPAPGAHRTNNNETDHFVALTDEKPLRAPPAKLVCFYLPQFHAIPENDAWWGQGFTEWTNVQPAQAQFAGHYQPHIPGELGYYNLLDSETQRRQIELAKLYGIGGFCFYFYWFGGKRLLEQPLTNYLADRSLDLPFCLCWANENWSRRWDGLESEILIAQQHSVEDDLAFIEHVANYMRDPRYLRIEGKPLLLVYRPGLLPSAQKTALRWRHWCKTHGIGEIFLAYTQSFENCDPAQYGFDAAIEFPPNNSAPPNVTGSVTPLRDDFACTVYDWRVLVERSEHYVQHAYTLFRSVCPSWDNTARRKNRGTIFVNSTPALYQRWLQNAIRDTAHRQTQADKRLIFINAWNEWAEGAHLEPDARHGYAWLQATRNALLTESENRRCILLVTHDCHPHGAQFLSLEMGRELSGMGFELAIVALSGGKLQEEFAQLAPFIDAENATPDELNDFLRRFNKGGNANAITSTVVCGTIVASLKAHGYRVLSLIHELSGVIRAMKQEKNAAAIAEHADKLVFPAAIVRDQYTAIAPVSNQKTLIRPQGLLRKNPYRGRATEAQREVCRRHRLPENTRIVLNIAYLDHRKGADLFVEIANCVLQKRQDIAFIWVGHAEREMEVRAQRRIAELGIQEKVILAGFDPDPRVYYAAATAYALTSREDPFPNVVLESTAVGVPVVAFSDTTGAADFILEKGGRLARHIDTDDFAKQLLALIDQPAPISLPLFLPLAHELSLRRYLLDLLNNLDGTPRVSVVVPNYNYADLIERRLDSIGQQHWPVYELIVLDDASTDDSVDRIHRYCKNKEVEASLHVNAGNSGSVFRQWKKGVEMASGDLVWIAEADDVADPEFLASLVSAFQDNETVLAFCQSKQIDEKDRLLANDYLAYTQDVSDRWQKDYSGSGLAEIRDALCIKNTIPNVSGVLFRRSALLHALAELGDSLFDYRVAGDWLIYLHVLSQGRIHYCAHSLNSHCRHQRSVTTGTALGNHLAEVAAVQKIARQMSAPSERTVTQARSYLEKLREQFGLADEVLREESAHAP